MERYQVVGHLRLDPEGTATSYADAQAQIEALQRENECKDTLIETLQAQLAQRGKGGENE